MALYKAYGQLTAQKQPRKPFLVAFGEDTPIALKDNGSAPDLTIRMEVKGIAPSGGSGTAVWLYLAPTAGSVITKLDLRVVIIPTLDLADIAEGTTPKPGNSDFLVLEYHTVGNDPMPPLVVLEAGQATNAKTVVDPGGPSDPTDPTSPTLPLDERLDDEMLVEACIPGHPDPMRIAGGLVNGPMIIMPGVRIRTPGTYRELATSIRGIDLGRVEAAPPAGAKSPREATWFDVTATMPPPPPAGSQTHLKVTVRTPNATTVRPAAPTAAVGAAPVATGASLFAGTYDYRVAYVHANGNEGPLGTRSSAVTLPVAGSVTVSNIPLVPSTPATPPIVARRVYRRGPDGGDDHLVAHITSPTTVTVTDPTSIDVDATHSIAPGYFGSGGRLSIRYVADTPLDVRAAVTLLAPEDADTEFYGIQVDRAPTEILVVNDDRGTLRPNLQSVRIGRPRVRWTANARTPRVAFALPKLSTPRFGTGADATLYDAPVGFGFDWRVDGILLTRVELRGRDDLTFFTDPPPFLGESGADAIGQAAVRLGAGHPAAVWPAGEGTVGIELIERDVDPYAAIAARGLRMAAFNQGDGWPPPYHPDRVQAEMLLGRDPSHPPGGDRTLRLRRDSPTLKWWGRVGVLPDSFAFDGWQYGTGQPWVGDVTDVTIKGRLRRLVGEMSRGPGRRSWFAIDDTGDGEVHLNTDDVDTHVDAPIPLQVTAAVLDSFGSRGGRIDAQVRVPPSLYVHHDLPGDGGGTARVSAMPDGISGRVAVHWFTPGVGPLAARSNPQVRVRSQPLAPASETLGAVSGRIYGLTAAEFSTSRELASIPVSRVAASMTCRDDRPNHSMRFEMVERDGRIDPGTRFVWQARLGQFPDSISGETRGSSATDAGIFFAKVQASSAFRDGTVWGEPAFHRAPGDPRWSAGVGNVSVPLIEEIPATFEFVNLEKIPFQVQGTEEYASGQLRPRVKPPGSANAQVGGARILLGGRLALASTASITAYDKDDGIEGGGKQAKWSQYVIPKLIVDFEPNPVGDAPKAIWFWKYESPRPPVNPTDEQREEHDDEKTEATAFRIGEGLLVTELALREYVLHAHSSRAYNVWDKFTPDTEAGEPVNKWLFKTDLQMRGYRGEITILSEAPSMFDKMDNPYGDWEAGPGNWYLRGRDQLKLLVYVGDVYFGTMGNSNHVPGTNGIHSTMAEIYTFVWPT